MSYIELILHEASHDDAGKNLLNARLCKTQPTDMTANNQYKNTNANQGDDNIETLLGNLIEISMLMRVFG